MCCMFKMRIQVSLLLFYLGCCCCQSNVWSNEVNCQINKCAGGGGNKCLVSTKSITGPNPANQITPSSEDQFYQCRFSGPPGFDSSTSQQVSLGDNTYEIDIGYAEMWKCKNGASITSPTDCTSELLLNVFSLTRYWCQKKLSCTFDRGLLLSYANNWEGSNQSQDGPVVIANAAFEWKENSVSSRWVCSENSILVEENCYKLPPRGLSWSATRRYCLDQGGDLARYTDTTDFASILKSLGVKIADGESAKTWFKWYTWDDEQRSVQNFGEYEFDFQCDVSNRNLGGINPLSKCSGGTTLPQVVGLCILPPKQENTNIAYETTQCTYRCVDLLKNGTCYDWYTNAEANTLATQPCPTGYVGNATWFCLPNNQWETINPDLSKCTSEEVSNAINDAISNITDSNEPPTDTIANLNNNLDNKTFISGDLLETDKFVVAALDSQKRWLANSSVDDATRESEAKSFTNAMMDLFHIILKSTAAFWGFLPYQRFQFIDQVQLHVEETQILLGGLLLTADQPYNRTNETLTVQVELVEGSDQNATKSFIIDTDQFLTLPAGYQYYDPLNAFVSFVDYSVFLNLLYGDQLIEWEKEFKQGKNPSPMKNVLNSITVGATLGNGSIQLEQSYVEVNLLKLLDRHFSYENLSCVYWDHDTQFWSSDGCVLQYDLQNSKTVSCLCDHLTNFAVIVDVNGLFKESSPVALDAITLIDTTISIISLIFALIIFFGVGTLRSKFIYHIHRNLCLSLLIADVLLLFGLDATYNYDLCISMAILQHFFFLCTFGWTLAEGIYLYFLIAQVFEGTGLKRWQYYLIGFGLPVVIVSVTVGMHFGLDEPLYDTTYHCWLSTDYGAIWAFLAPVAVVILINVAVLAFAIWKAIELKRKSYPANKDRKNSRMIFGVLSLTFILGITWIFGFLLFNEQTIWAAYIFTILNSLQGAVLFLTLCLFSRQVRDELDKKLTRSERFQRIVLYLNTFNVDSQSDGESITWGFNRWKYMWSLNGRTDSRPYTSG